MSCRRTSSAPHRIHYADTFHFSKKSLKPNVDERFCVQQHDTLPIHNEKTSVRKRVTPQLLPSATSDGRTAPKQRTFHHLQHLLFNKTVIPISEHKRQQLESRFWAPSRDEVCRVPAEVYTGPWQSSTLGNDGAPYLRKPAQDTNTSNELSKWSHVFKSLLASKHVALKSSKLRRCLDALLVKWTASCELIASIEPLLIDCASTAEHLQQIWTNVSLNMVEQLHKLSEALFVEELADAQRKRALLALKYSATSRENDSINRSADAELQLCTSRLHSFRAVNQTISDKSYIIPVPINPPIYPSDMSGLSGTLPTLVLIAPLASDKWASYWEVFDTTTLQRAHLARYTCRYDATISTASLTAWASRINAALNNPVQTLKAVPDLELQNLPSYKPGSSSSSTPSVQELSRFHTNEEVVTYLTTKQWNDMHSISMSAPPSVQPLLVHNLNYVFFPKVPRISSVRAVKTRHIKTERSARETTFSEISLFGVSTALASTLSLAVAIQSQRFDLPTRRMYFWACCKLALEWEEENRETKALLPLLPSQLFLDGPRVFIYPGLALALQRVAMESIGASTEQTLHIRFSCQSANNAATSASGTTHIVARTASISKKCYLKSASKSVPKSASHKVQSNFIASWIAASASDTTNETTFPCCLYRNLPSWLVHLWCSALQATQKSLSETLWLEVRSVIHGYFLLQLYAKMRETANFAPAMVRQLHPSSEQTPIQINGSTNDNVSNTFSEALSNEETPIITLIEKQKTLSLSSVEELELHREVLPTASMLLQRYAFLSAFHPVYDLHPGVFSKDVT